MWFLKGRPSSITVDALVGNLPLGYQLVNYRFKVEADRTKEVNGVEMVWFGLVFPWAPQKENGGYSPVGKELDYLSTLSESFDSTLICPDDVTVHEQFRKLKNDNDAELVHVQDLRNCYIDDYGILLMWVQVGKWYQINYKHKMAADSQLFFPTHLPTVIGGSSQKPIMSVKVWVTDGLTYQLPKYVQKVPLENAASLAQQLSTDSQKVSTIDRYVISPDPMWNWDEDTRFPSENWDSSDDDAFESDNE